MLLVATGLMLVLSAARSDAHPLGNFTVNVYSGIRVQPARVLIDYVVDMAEIPAFQARADIDADGGGTIDGAESAAHAERTCAALARDLTVTTDVGRRPLRVLTSDVTFPPGSGGLPTLRLTCTFSADAESVRRVGFVDSSYPGRVGWREVTAVGDATTLVASDVPATSSSARLTRYPDDLLQSPLDVRRATLVVGTGGPPAGDTATGSGPIATRGIDRLNRSFTALVGRQQLTIPFGMLAVLLAIVLGAVHALAPGHGKTVMAAYMVGMEGSLRQAMWIGLTVTATHTAGVLALGVVLSLSSAAAPERVYPWLGLASGVLLVLIGVRLVLRAFGVRRATKTALHEHGHAHNGVGALSMRRSGLLTVGFAGGLVPSPSALVVLLGAIALHRVWFGIVLVLLYGLGMASALVGTGLALSRLRVRLRSVRGARAMRVAAALPLVTSVAIVILGGTLALRALTQGLK
jgi:ABC-type nickel/cobalt efflux system permease component RcnA